MKRERIGRRFSRRVRVTYSPDELRDFFAHSARNAETLAELIAHNVEVAQRLLRDAGLPDSPVLHWPPGAQQPKPGEGEMTPDDSPVGTTYRLCTLDHYVTRDRGYPDDSDVGLAARIVRAAHELARQEGASRDRTLFELGHLVTLAKVYGIYGRTREQRNRTNAKAPRPARQKVTAEALEKYGELRKKNPRRAAGIVANLYGVKPAAVRAAARKKPAT